MLHLGPEAVRLHLVKLAKSPSHAMAPSASTCSPGDP
ncbi:MAG: hypothetical protein ACRDVM_02295 [Acidimicrobiia bacterium]